MNEDFDPRSISRIVFDEAEFTAEESWAKSDELEEMLNECKRSFKARQRKTMSQ